MRKGIVATIVIYSLVQLGSFLLTDFIQKLQFLNFNINEEVWDLSPLLLYPYQVIGFILLGFHLNNKYKNTVTYLLFLFTGIIVSVLSSTTYYSIDTFLNVNYKSYLTPFTYTDTMTRIIGTTIFMIITCSIIAIFHKKLKRTPNNDSLDSDIVNNE